MRLTGTPSTSGRSLNGTSQSSGGGLDLHEVNNATGLFLNWELFPQYPQYPQASFR